MSTAAWKTPLSVAPGSPVRCEHCRRLLEPPKAARRFGLLDGMILIAVTAAGLTVARQAPGRFSGGTWYQAYLMAPTLLGAWTLALLAIRLRGPRPALRRLLRQPGMVASTAATAVIAVGLLGVAVAAIVRHVRLATLRSQRPGMFQVTPSSPAPADWMTWLVQPFFQFIGLVGPAVLGAWVLLALSGRRKPERGLIDILGRLVGACWIVLFVGSTFARLIGMFRF